MGRTGRKRKRNDRDSKGDSSDVVELLKWLRLKGTMLEVRFFGETGRGIQCRKTVEPGDELISLPLNSIITPGVESEVFSVFDREALRPQLALSLFLMYERHLSEESCYVRYIKLLPSSYTTLFFCTGDEILCLPSFMKEKVIDKIQELKRQHRKVIEIFSTKQCRHCGVHFTEIFQYSNFTWAWFTVNTRSVYYKDGDCDSLALAPLLDMFNHSHEAKTELLIDQKRKLYTVKTLNQYKKREQIFINYGAHSNLKLLLEYGFILENNPHDFVEFSFGDVLSSAKTYNPDYGDVTREKYKLIKQNNLKQNLTKNANEFSWNIKSLLYLLVTNDCNVSVINAKCYSNEFSGVERRCIDAISLELTSRKREEFLNDLKKMETIKDASQGFAFAKRLLEIYVEMLT